MPAQARSWVTGYFQLVLDGIEVGIVQKAGGGTISAERVELHDDADLALQAGPSMGQPFKDWISATLLGGDARKSGELRAADPDRKVKQVVEFQDAHLTEIGFPACDAAAKDPAYITVAFASRGKRVMPGAGAQIDESSLVSQNLFRPENFRLTIDGLEATCAKVSKVEALTIKQTVARDRIRTERDHELIPGKLEMPNLKITFNENAVEPIATWHKDSRATNTVSQEKTGLLEFLDVTRQKVLLSLELRGLGVVSVKAAERTNNDDRVASVTAEMYCDEITIKEWLA